MELNKETAADILYYFFKMLHDECEKNLCTQCFFRVDHVCILDCEPEDYNLDIIKEAIEKTIEKEAEGENGTE